MKELPGNEKHRVILRWVLNHYERDERIQAIVLFGSLGRGDWDRFSDVDLDVILGDDVGFDLGAELLALRRSAAAADPIVLAVVDGPDELKLLLESFTRMSVRFHELETTSPAIITDMYILVSRLPAEIIAAAGNANRRPAQRQPREYMDHFYVYAAEVADYLARGQLWLAFELLHRMSRLLVDLYGLCHGEIRSLHAFGQSAPPGLQARLGQTVAPSDRSSLRRALLSLVELAGDELATVSAGSLASTGEWEQVADGVRRRLRESTPPVAPS